MQSFCNNFSTVLFQDSKHVGKIVDVDDDGGVGASGDVTETSNVTGAKLKVDADAKQKLVDKSEDSPSEEALKNNPLLAQVRSVPEIMF